ncbi:MAG: hypothetical protein AAFQ82_12055, partial [Myxococcota bacterium]
MTRRVRRYLFCAALFASGCTEERETVQFGQAGEGESCSQVSDCQAGLDCVDDVCAPIIGDAPQAGSPCTSDSECGDGFICGRQGLDGQPAEPSETRLCTDVELLGEGDSCGFTVQCDFSLV